MARDRNSRLAGWQGCQLKRAEQALADREQRLRRAASCSTANLIGAIAASSPTGPPPMP